MRRDLGKLSRRWRTWPTSPARPVSTASQTIGNSEKFFFFFFLTLHSVRRYLGPPSGRGENVQAPELGGGVQTVVPGPEDPPVPRRQEGAPIQEKGTLAGTENARTMKKSPEYLTTPRSLPQRWAEANGFHVCLTTYKLLMKDHAHFLDRKWKQVVLDEVQLIRNMTEKHWERVFNLRR